ncbi:phosphohistidine phosphatase SixA [bacterium]|nr:phosphohistidine phosphatase SixA [bacterium]
MNLYLVRHGKPKPEEEDPTRSLSEKGIRDIQKLYSFVSENHDIQVQKIIHSPKLRAKQTADILSNYLRPHPRLEEVSGLKPLDDPHIWKGHLSEMTEDIILVGHLPHLSELVSLLLNLDKYRDRIGFTAGEMVCLHRDQSSTWSFQWSMKPEDVI